MGTNYYVVKNGPSIHGGIHIGKSSAGWLFNFQSQNEPYSDPPIVWNTWPQVLDWLDKYTGHDKDYVIMDEYDQIVTLEEFIEIVEWKQNDEWCRSNKDNFSLARNVDGYRFTDFDFS